MKFIAILLSNLILIQSLNIDLENFSKINILLEHAQFHQEKYGDSFFEFLVEHYGEVAEIHENEHEEHQDLPFKDNHHLCAHTSISFIEVAPKFIFTVDDSVNNSIIFFYKDTFSSFEKQAVFQPPKFS